MLTSDLPPSLPLPLPEPKPNPKIRTEPKSRRRRHRNSDPLRPRIRRVPEVPRGGDSVADLRRGVRYCDHRVVVVAFGELGAWLILPP